MFSRHSWANKCRHTTHVKRLARGCPAFTPTAGAACAQRRCCAREPSMRSVLFRVSANERIAVRHLYLRQSLCVHHFVFADNLVAGENESGERVYLGVRERLWLRPWHRPSGEVEDGGRVRHIERHGSVRLARRAYEHGVISALPVWTVADFALLRVDHGAFRGCPAAGRQTFAIRADANVPK